MTSLRNPPGTFEGKDDDAKAKAYLATLDPRNFPTTKLLSYIHQKTTFISSRILTGRNKKMDAAIPTLYRFEILSILGKLDQSIAQAYLALEDCVRPSVAQLHFFFGFGYGCFWAIFDRD